MSLVCIHRSSGSSDRLHREVFFSGLSGWYTETLVQDGCFEEQTIIAHRTSQDLTVSF
jgi:hypothetical protein